MKAIAPAVVCLIIGCKVPASTADLISCYPSPEKPDNGGLSASNSLSSIGISRSFLKRGMGNASECPPRERSRKPPAQSPALSPYYLP